MTWRTYSEWWRNFDNGFWAGYFTGVGVVVGLGVLQWALS